MTKVKFKSQSFFTSIKSEQLDLKSLIFILDAIDKSSLYDMFVSIWGETSLYKLIYSKIDKFFGFSISFTIGIIFS